jgi:hypothetical protein
MVYGCCCCCLWTRLDGRRVLSVLRLFVNRIGDEGAVVLADMLRDNVTLTDLYLEPQVAPGGFGARGLIVLTAAVRLNLGLLDYEGPGQPLLTLGQRQSNREVVGAQSLDAAAPVLEARVTAATATATAGDDAQAANVTMEQLEANPNIVCMVKRSKNLNVVVYEAKHSNGVFDTKEPLEVYWMDIVRHPLLFFFFCAVTFCGCGVK